MGKPKRNVGMGSVGRSSARKVKVSGPSAGHIDLEGRALDLVKLGRLQEAEEIYRKIIAAGDSNHAVCNSLAAICMVQGRLDEAVGLLGQALELNPSYPEAYVNLGNALKAQGKLDAAVASYRKALKIRQNFPEAYNNLGSALQEQGNLDAAIASINKALELNPGYSKAHDNLGNALKAQGDLDAAIASFNKVLELNPSCPEAHVSLGVALHERGNFSAAIASCHKALALRPNYPEAYNNLGFALQEQGNFDAAIASYNKALTLKPDYPEVHNNLGNALQEQGNLDAAIASYSKALAIRPDCPQAHNNLGNALQGQGDLPAAIACYGKALELNYSYPDAHYNLGNAFQEQGDLPAAIASYGMALELSPGYPGANWNLSHSMLLGGDYKNGWEKYEYRFRRKSGQVILHANPQCIQWSGSELKANDELILVSEQGFGDTLQFMRYALAFRRKGIQVSLCAPQNLHSLIRISGIDSAPLTPEQANAVTEGHWIPLLSLPRYLEVSPSNPLITEPYIQTTEELRSKWQGILAGEKRPIIGINWQGNPEHEKTNSKGRSLPLEAFAPIAQHTNASLLSLQKGFGSEQLETCSFKERFVSCQKQVNETWDFLETAAIIANCDLVITSDTSVAHLAGGLGKTTWLLLKKVPEWRWGLEGETTFWYPSMRLFRQRERGNWDDVLQRVTEMLQTQFPGVAADSCDLLNQENNQQSAKLSAEYASLEKQAVLLINQGRHWEAEIIYREIIAAGASHHAVYSSLAAICVAQGRLDEAVNLLDQALERNPSYPEAYVNLGNALMAQGKLDDAVASYRKALKLRPDFPEAYNNLGLGLKEKGDLDAAIASYNKALELNANFPEALNNLGVALQGRGDLDAAIASINKALDLNPGYSKAHDNLGNALKEQGNLDAAIASFNKVLELNPSCPEAHVNLGAALHDRGDFSAAIALCHKALTLKPNYPEAHNNLGLALQEQGNFDAAIASYNKALTLKPDYPEVHNNLGNALQEQGDLDAAIASYGTALALNPDYPQAHNNLGIALQGQGDLDAAIAACNRALALRPDFPEAQSNLSMAELLSGEYKRGWARYEYRFQKKDGQRLLNARPRCVQWSGSNLRANDELLLVGEQGLGDTLQFMRYALALRKQGIRASLCAPQRLHSLIRVSGIDPTPLTPEQANAVTEGHWIPLLSLPRYLEVSPSNPLITEPYIQTTEELRSKWQGILAGEKRPIIGINWQGNPEHEKTNSKGRSLPLEAFAPIAQHTNASLLSLQKGFGSEQLETCSFKERFVSCQKQVNETWDFLETAAIIANCDLVITSDTSVAHLAGGLGKTTWLLLKKVPEWRWGLEGETTFWYPSMRLFRQRERGNWDDVLQRVTEMLQTHFPRVESDSCDFLTQDNNKQSAKLSADHTSLEHQAGLLINQGKYREAEAIYREIIAAGTNNHTAYGNLAAICGIQGRPDELIDLLNKALELNPNYPEAYYNLGKALEKRGDLSAAIASYNKALELRPNFPEAHSNLGNVLTTQGDLDAAIDSCNKAIGIRPNYPEAYSNLGNALQRYGDLSAAIASYHSALGFKPSYPEAHNNLGTALQESADFSAAIASYTKALAFKPDYPAAQINLSMAELLIGDYKAGWEKYDCRFQWKDGRAILNAHPQCPCWNGSDLKADDSLLLVGEQGLGDTLQFMRYSLALRRQGIQVSLCAPQKLHSLIKVSGIDPAPLTAEQANAVTEGRWIPLLSLPRHLEVGPGNPLITEPYIKTTEGRVPWSGVKPEACDLIAVG